MTHHSLTLGFIGFGEVNTPRSIIEKKCNDARSLLISRDFNVIDGGIVTDDPERIEAANAVNKLENNKIDVLILCVSGWIPSYVVVRLADQFKSTPMILWGLCGSYINNSLHTTAEQAGTSALRRPMEELGFKFKYVYDTTDGIKGIDSISSYLKVIQTQKDLLTSKVVMVGYRDMNLYGTMFDGVSLKKHIGTEIEFIEMLQMVQYSDNIPADDVAKYLTKIKSDWNFTKPADEHILEKGVKYFLSLKKFIDKYGYNAISILDVDGMKKLLNFPPSMIFMLLANELDICTTPENDSLGSVTQLITKGLTGQLSAYLEFYEYFRDRVLMGVPDYIPLEIVDGPYTVTPSNFGLLDECILNVSKLRTGTVTLSRLFKTKDGYGMHLALAEAVSPRNWQEIGWSDPAPQLPSLELVLGERTASFVKNVMAQHYIITYGDNTAILKEYCEFCGIEILES